MTDPNSRNPIEEALDLVPDHDPSNALRQLLDAAAKDDLTLAATVRENLPLLAFGLMSLGRVVEEVSKRKPRGRPKINPQMDIDCRRAIMCWHTVRILNLSELTNRDAITISAFLDAKADIPTREQIFSTSVKPETLEESVSRGKTKLGFTGLWECKACEGILAAL